MPRARTLKHHQHDRHSPARPRPFALASRYAAETAVVTIYDPADLLAKQDTGLRVEIKSVYSQEARDALERMQEAIAVADGEVKASTVDWAANLLEQTIAITMRWWDENGPADGILETPDAAATPCTPEHVRRIYSDPKTMWMQKQVQAAYLDLGRFFPKLKASS